METLKIVLQLLAFSCLFVVSLFSIVFSIAVFVIKQNNNAKRSTKRSSSSR